MTFEEKRRQLLAQFDEAAADLRRIVADPTWTNPKYRPFKDARGRLDRVIRNLYRLNVAEQE